MEWKVGDRVRVVTEYKRYIHVYKGLQGTIISTDGAACTLLVEFDEAVNGHNGGGRGKNGYCWWFRELDEQYTYGVPALQGDGVYLEKVRSNKKNNYW